MEESKNTNDENDRRQNKLLVEEMNLKQDIGKVKQNLEQHKGRQKQFKDAVIINLMYFNVLEKI